MNMKLRTMAIVTLCMSIISVTSVIMLDENEGHVDVVSEDEDGVNTYLASGVSRMMSDILTNADNDIITMEKVTRVHVKDSYCNEKTEPVIDMRYEEIPMDKITYVCVDLLNLRAGATTDSEVLVILEYGTELQVIGEMNIYKNNELVDQWTHVKYQDYTGYLKSDYLTDESPFYYLGSYDITYYCPCAICCGVETGITASGARAISGITVAADPSIPFGTELYIDGQKYIVQDRGGAIKGNHIDIFCDTHQEALNKARHNADVYMKIDLD